MNRCEFMKMAAAIAVGVSVPYSRAIPVPGMNYSQARDEIKRSMRLLLAGEGIHAGGLVYVADDGMAYAAK